MKKKQEYLTFECEINNFILVAVYAKKIFAIDCQRICSHDDLWHYCGKWMCGKWMCGFKGVINVSFFMSSVTGWQGPYFF